MRPDPSTLLQTVLALTAALLLVLALRAPLRRWLGARVAYALWWLPPLAVLASQLPAPVRVVEWPAASALVGAVATVAPAPGATLQAGIDSWLLLWLGGVAGALALLATRQWLFVRRLRPWLPVGPGVVRSAGASAPLALAGWRPLIVLPSDFEQRYSPQQQALMLAHERAHLAAGDLHAHALAALLACLAWWHPLAWWALRCFRLDQELACDARVLESRPQARQAYADAMLQSQLAAQRFRSPLGCHWPAGHPLKERIRMLKLSLPNAASRRRGFLLVVLLSLLLSLGVWAAQPAQVVGAQARLYDVRLLLTRPGQAPLMPRLTVREGEHSGIRSDEVEVDLKVRRGDKGLVWVATDVRLAGQPAGSPTLAMKPGEPGTVSIGAVDGQGFSLTLWVNPHASGRTDDGSGASLADIRTPPRYPAQAMKDGIEGTVMVEFQVDASGVVREARIASAEPPGVFDAAALAAVRGWWLNPANHPEPLPAWMQAPIRFELDEQEGG